MTRHRLFWPVVTGAVSVAVLVVFALMRDLTWSWPAVAALVLVGVYPVARSVGSRKALEAGKAARARRRAREDQRWAAERRLGVTRHALQRSSSLPGAAAPCATDGGPASALGQLWV